MYIKGHVSIHCTKDQSNAYMCENDVEGVERTLTVLIVTHVAHVERVERSLNSLICYSCYSSQKSRKWCLWLLHNTLCRGVKTLHKVASRPCQEGKLLYCVSLPSWGFSCSPLVSLRRQLC